MHLCVCLSTKICMMEKMFHFLFVHLYYNVFIYIGIHNTWSCTRFFVICHVFFACVYYLLLFWLYFVVLFNIFLQFYLSFMQFLLQFCVLVACGILFQGINRAHVFIWCEIVFCSRVTENRWESEAKRECVIVSCEGKGKCKSDKANTGSTT